MSYLSLLERYPGVLKKDEYWFSEGCPFHFETDTSMSANVNTGKWYCFGCHKGGFLEVLVAKLEGISPEDARHFIRRHGGKRGISSSAKPTYRYLSPDLMERFFLVADSDTDYKNYLFKMRKIPRKLAAEYDLRAGNAMIGVWHERIIYAIHDLKGNICSIEGRTINGSPIRYYKEPGSRAGIGMFGLNKFKGRTKAERGKRPLYIAEGMFDALSLAAIGKDSVGMCCSAITPEQAGQLRMVTEYPVVILDGIRPGTEEARKEVVTSISRELKRQFGNNFAIHTIKYKQQDPNSLLLKGKLREYVKKIAV